MGARLRLEVFDGVATAEAATGPGAVASPAVEDIRLAAYEKGYSAGWEDAAASQSEDQQRLRDDLAGNLRNLSFTYWEARAHLLQGLEPLLRGMVDRILPAIARDTLGASVAAVLQAEAERLATAPAVVDIAPGDRAAVETALGAEPALAVSLRETPDLNPGQVRLRFGEAESHLDLGATLDAIGRLVADFLQSTQTTEQRQTRHG